MDGLEAHSRALTPQVEAVCVSEGCGRSGDHGIDPKSHAISESTMPIGKPKRPLHAVRRAALWR